MTRLAARCILGLTLVTGLASAHAHLQGSTPADGSTLATAPSSVSLQFVEPVQLTAAAIRTADANTHKLGPLPTAPSKAFTVGLPPVGAGDHVITWRAVSDDRHVMSGSIKFTVRAATTSALK